MSSLRKAPGVLMLVVGASLPMCSSASAPTPPVDSGPMPPPRICKTPSPPQGTWFTDVTASVLPNATVNYEAPTAYFVRSADLDGDGYPDMITSAGQGYPTHNLPAGNTRRDTSASRTRNVWMNRPDPNSTGRVFVDATEDSNLLATRDGKGGYAFWMATIGDVNNDGFPDVVLGPSDPGDPTTTPPRPPDDSAAVALNDGTGHFHLGPDGPGLDAVTGFSTWTAALLDFDRDGILDYLPGTFNYPPPATIPPMLLKGAGDGTFQQVAAAYGIVSKCYAPSNGAPTCPPMYGLTACDLDMDGDQDILFASYGREPNQVWRNDGDHFTEIGVSVGLAYDQRMDYTDDESYQCYCQVNAGACAPSVPAPPPGFCNAFGGNEGRGWQPGYSDKPWSLGGNNYSLACADIDNDGDMDIMTSTVRHQDVGSTSDPSELCYNDTPPGMPLGMFRRPGGAMTGIDRPGFEDFAVNGDWNEGDHPAAMLDLDNDGRKDVYLGCSDYPGDHGWFFHQKADGTFEDLTTTTGLGQNQGHGFAFIDFDRDGDLDVAIGTSADRVGGIEFLKFYRNEVGQDQNWLQVKLVGLGAGHTNVSGIGALVTVKAGGVTQMQELSGSQSYEGMQNDLVLTFGLGATCDIDSVQVRWLDAMNTVATFTGVMANYRVQITEGKPTVDYLM